MYVSSFYILQVRRGVSASMFAPEEAAARELDIDLRRAVRILPHLQASRPYGLEFFFCLKGAFHLGPMLEVLPC